MILKSSAGKKVPVKMYLIISPFGNSGFLRVADITVFFFSFFLFFGGGGTFRTRCDFSGLELYCLEWLSYFCRATLHFVIVITELGFVTKGFPCGTAQLGTYVN